MQVGIPVVIIRGGTSKGLFFHEADLPKDQKLRDEILLAAMGSPDPRQIDGMGGSYSTTSKVAIIGPSTRPDADVDYTFAQVSVTQALVDYKGNCGNISAGVGPFAIDEGLVEAKEPMTVVRIHNTNTGKIIHAEVAVRDGKADIYGDTVIPGVPGTGAEIRLGFVDPGGSVTGKLLPTGNARDEWDIPGFGPLTVSCVDAANPLVFVRAADLGMTGTESAETIDANERWLDLLETIRSVAAEKCGIIDDYRRATDESPAVPKIAIVAPPASYKTAVGEEISADDIDLCARIMSMQKAHRAYALTGGIATAAAACIPGTVVEEVVRKDRDPEAPIRLGHPGGAMPLYAVAETVNGEVQIRSVKSVRTSRRLMEGTVYVPSRKLSAPYNVGKTVTG